MLSCLTCGGTSPLCSRCVDERVESLRGAARARGISWAMRVAAKLGDRAPATWPPYAGKCRARAEQLVDGLHSDERVIERLAVEAYEDARRWWSMRLGK